jgi:hypothetical protein
LGYSLHHGVMRDTYIHIVDGTLAPSQYIIVDGFYKEFVNNIRVYRQISKDII